MRAMTGKAAAETARFVRANARFGERALESGHVTASAWVMDAGGRQGAADPSCQAESLGAARRAFGSGRRRAWRAAALREVREESGLTQCAAGLGAACLMWTCISIPARGDVPAHRHYDLRFLCVAASEEPLRVSDESHDVAWVALADVPIADAGAFCIENAGENQRSLR